MSNIESTYGQMPQSLSIVMPAYNVSHQILHSINRVLAAPHTGELIVVDDGSTDATAEVARSVGDERVRVLQHENRLGKGAAIRCGAAQATRPYLLVQDPLLRYAPDDYDRLLQPLADGKADAVFGSRFSGSQHRRVHGFWHTKMNRALTVLSNSLTNLNLTDMCTYAKAFRRDVFNNLRTVEDGAGFDPEVAAKLAAQGCRVYEVSVSYDGHAGGAQRVLRDDLRLLYSVFRHGLARRGPGPTATFDEADSELAATLAHLEEITPNYVDWIMALMSPYLGRYVLEIGSGHGTITRRLLGESERVVASDPSERCVQVLQSAFAGEPAIEIVHGDAAVALQGRSIDTAVLVNVLEHIPDDKAELTRLRAALPPGAAVLIFAPAFPALYSDYDRRIGHFRRYRRSELIEVVTEAGFDVGEARYVNLPGFFAWLLIVRLLRGSPTTGGLAGFYDRLAVPLVRQLESRLPPPIGQSLLCVALVPDE